MRPGAILVATLLLAGCVSPAGMAPGAKLVDPDALTVGSSLARAQKSPGAWPRADWWTSLGDTQLDALMLEALGSNPGLGLARARIAAAEAAVVAAGGPLGLGVSLTGSAGRQRLSEHGLVPAGYGGRLITQSQVSMEFSWEFDFWDRNRAALDAEIGRLNATAAEEAAAVLALSTRIAEVYLRLSAVLARRATAEGLSRRQEAILTLARERAASGLDPQIGLHEAEADAAGARGALAAYQAQAVAARNELAALAGKGPDYAAGIVPLRALVQVAADQALPAELPADLIGRRPDIAALRMRIEAAGRDVDAARAAYYPDLNLAGYVGLQSIGLARLLNSGSTVFGVGPALRLPLFGSARLASGLAARNAERDALVEQYNARVVEALREIVDLVAASDAAGRQQSEAQSAAASGALALALVRGRAQAGLSGRLPVLEAEVRQIEREQRVTDLRHQRLALRVALVRALGGGFDPDTKGHAEAGAGAGVMPSKGPIR